MFLLLVGLLAMIFEELLLDPALLVVLGLALVPGLDPALLILQHRHNEGDAQSITDLEPGAMRVGGGRG